MVFTRVSASSEGVLGTGWSGEGRAAAGFSFVAPGEAGEGGGEEVAAGEEDGTDEDGAAVPEVPPGLPQAARTATARTPITEALRPER
ncbi:hypothetical protein [Sphaerisporangium fuscum]|uniref:hypothetical protein n=1 Tax=Sphaerisporangium fuscum TaxID=2835868 RepID=UPI001BDD2268|nr:hypothetical protein [Sphaerisporangium fuscum]